MKHWLSKMSLQKKILFSYGLLFAVSLTALLIFFSRSYRQERTTELSHMRQYNGQLSLNLDTMIANTDSFRYLHFSDDKIRNLLTSNDQDIDPENHRQMGEKLKERLTLLADMGNYVLRATIVTADGRVYENVTENNPDYIEKMNQMIQGIQWEKESPSYFSEVHREEINLVGYQVVSMVSPVWNVIGEEPIATIYLDLDFGKIVNQWYQSADVSRNSEFLVMSQGQILFDSDQQLSGAIAVDEEFGGKLQDIVDAGKQEGILEIHKKRCVAAIEKNEDTGWYLVQYMPNSYLSSRILDNMSVFLILLVTVVIVTIAAGYLLARQMSSPIRELSQVMSKVANDTEDQQIALFEEGSMVREDEVGQMIHSYNAMAKRINDNIIKTYIYKLNQKQTELKMLQFQINPHFLYNALNTISAIAKLQDVEYIPEISSSLSEMFRYNISGDDIVAIREELEQTENYMCIQKIRFPERFEMKIQVEEELRECQVLKFVLQPIVENAYKYGFAQKRKKDILSIRGYRENDRDIILVVEDNGVGMEPEQVEKLNRAFGNEDAYGKSVGIGLRNVNARLKNYYGTSYGIRVESQLGCFTRVYLKIKYVKKPKEDGE